MANVTTTTAANLLVDRWKREMQIDPNEELVVAANAWDLDGEKIGNKIYVRKVATIGATTFSSGTSLTYTANTEARTTVSPVAAYAATQVERPVLNRMLSDSELATAHRKQIQAGLDAHIDSSFADDAVNLSSQTGGAGNNLTESLIWDSLQTLKVNAKAADKDGGMRYFIIHTSQFSNLMQIAAFSQADIRGDAANPKVTGFVHKAAGLMISDSANVWQAGGLSYNLLHLKKAIILAYNERPTMLEPQPEELTTRFIGYTEFGVAENYDNFAVAVLTDA